MDAALLQAIEQTALDSLPLQLKSIVYGGLKSLSNDCGRNITANLNGNRCLLTEEQLLFYKNVMDKCSEAIYYLEETTTPQQLQLLQHFSPNKQEA